MAEGSDPVAAAVPDAINGDELTIPIPVPEGYGLDVTSHVSLADDGMMNAIGDAEVVEGMNEGFKVSPETDL